MTLQMQMGFINTLVHRFISIACYAFRFSDLSCLALPRFASEYRGFHNSIEITTGKREIDYSN